MMIREEGTLRREQKRRRASVSMFDVFHFEMALIFLNELDNEVEALDELNTLEPANQLDPTTGELRAKCQARAKRRWQHNADLAERICEANPVSRTGKLYRRYCERQLSQAQSGVSTR